MKSTSTTLYLCTRKMKIKCIICNSNFEKIGNTKSCSKQCSLKYKQIKKKLSNENNKDIINKRNNLYYHKNSAKLLEQQKNYYHQNKEIINQKRRLLYVDNKEKILNRKKIYYENNKEQYLNNVHKYRLNHLAQIKKTKKNYYEVNKDIINIKNKDNYEVNKEQYLKQQVKYRRHKYKTDECYMLMERLRSRIRAYLKITKINKSNTTREILGCTPQELKIYLEKQFTLGMSWKNKHTWHIDHIIPLSKATNKDELYKLCHYTNLQPLWALDNIKKSNN